MDEWNKTRWSVGGFKHDFYVPFHIWDVILPTDELIFFKMVFAPPTSTGHTFTDELGVPPWIGNPDGGILPANW